MTSSDHVFALVRRALDEFDDRPLEVSVRRAVRIASLVGDSRTAVRLGYELRGVGGDRQANGADTRRLMADPSTWGTHEGHAEEALREYCRDRMRSNDPADDTLLVHSLSELEFWEKVDSRLDAGMNQEALEVSLKMRQISARTRHRAFTTLVSWERQFGYASINESIFGSYQRQVDRLLSDGAPDLVEQFTAVYRRLSEAASRDPEKPAAEELSQAITTCRRILKAVVDHVFPPTSETSAEGHSLDDSRHRNRLTEFVKRSIDSKSNREMTTAMISGLYGRFVAVDALTNKAVHAAMALETANLCALNTYVICGEILRVHALDPSS